MNKQALTDIPLSPEEKYEASKLMGRSLFSAMQLAREQEERRNKMFKLPGMQDEKTLAIPIPASLMPVHNALETKMASDAGTVSFIEDQEGNGFFKANKDNQYKGPGTPIVEAGTVMGAGAGHALASASGIGALLGGAAGGVVSGNPGYTGKFKYDESRKKLDDSIEHLFELQQGEGLGAHVKRNIGKYVGGTGGGLLAKAMKGKLRLLAPFAGLALGHAYDKKQKEEIIAEALKNPESVYDMLTDVKLRNEMREKNASDTLNGLMAQALSGAKESPVRLLMGGNAGFRDARKEYYFNQRAKIQEEIAAAQKEYIDTLSRIKTGSAEESGSTPLVDAFCNGMAHYVMFGKTAALGEDVDISDGSVRRFLGDAVGGVYRHLPVVKPATDFAASSLLNTAAGTAYLTYLMRKKMREEPDKYMEQHTPTKVELQPF